MIQMLALAATTGMINDVFVIVFRCCLQLRGDAYGYIIDEPAQ